MTGRLNIGAITFIRPRRCWPRPSPRGAWTWWRWAIVARVAADEFDVVHVHHLGKGALMMASAPGASRFVFTGHDPRLMNGYRVSWRRLESFRFVVRRADAVVALSDAELQFTLRCVPGLAGLCRHDRERLPQRYLLPPTATPRLAPSLPARPFQLLFVGQLIPMKAVDLLLEAMAILGPRIKFNLKVVYQNSTLERSLRLAARLGIADRVDFLGLKSATEIAELYRAADLFVLPSHGECSRR